MGSLNPSPELSLNSNPAFIPKSITQFLSQVSTISSVTEKLQQVDDYVNRLESETRKIEAFKRELPLCMLIFNDTIVALKAESMELRKAINAQPVYEEFIPIKKNFDNDDDDDDDAKIEKFTNGKENADKKNWLSSTHLWNSNEDLSNKKREKEDVGRTNVNENNRLFSCFVPNVQSNIQIDSINVVAPPQQHTFRKQRRCWSAELHRLFVDALQRLGGSQVATPKQIRELMKVDGLTNDEVKSHLQKYRLHIRKSTTPKPKQAFVNVEGGSWMSKCSSSKSSSPNGPLLSGGNTIEDEEEEKSENCCWNGNL